MKWAGLVSRPVLLWEALRTAWSFRSRKGLLPSRPLLRWRLATAYGSAEVSPDPDDLIRFLAWRREMRRHSGTGRRGW